jgi:hypothetical protein
MAPTEHTVPVSSLEQNSQYVKKNFKDKRRRLPHDFSLKRDCELFEIVQYSSISAAEMKQTVKQGGPKAGTVEYYPFVRLFRRCGSGADVFHIETTAWEGEYAWKPKKLLEGEVTPVVKDDEPIARKNKSWWSWT